MKYKVLKVLFSLKINEKVFINVVYCSRDWLLKSLRMYSILECFVIQGSTYTVKKVVPMAENVQVQQNTLKQKCK